LAAKALECQIVLYEFPMEAQPVGASFAGELFTLKSNLWLSEHFRTENSLGEI